MTPTDSKHRRRISSGTLKSIITGAVIGYSVGGGVEAYHHPLEQTMLKAKITQAIMQGNAWAPRADPEFYRTKKELIIDPEKRQIAGVNSVDGLVLKGFYRNDGTVMLSPGDQIFENFRQETVGFAQKIRSWYQDLTSKDETQGEQK